MSTTYQPFILKLIETIFEELKDEIKPAKSSKKYLGDLLTQKFIDGKISEGDMGIFDSEDELHRFVHQCKVNEDLDSLWKRGLIGSYDDGETFFITKVGKIHVEKMLDDF